MIAHNQLFASSQISIHFKKRSFIAGEVGIFPWLSRQQPSGACLESAPIFHRLFIIESVLAALVFFVGFVSPIESRGRALRGRKSGSYPRLFEAFVRFAHDGTNRTQKPGTSRT